MVRNQCASNLIRIVKLHDLGELWAPKVLARPVRQRVAVRRKRPNRKRLGRRHVHAKVPHPLLLLSWPSLSFNGRGRGDSGEGRLQPLRFHRQDDRFLSAVDGKTLTGRDDDCHGSSEILSVFGLTAGNNYLAVHHERRTIVRYR